MNARRNSAPVRAARRLLVGVAVAAGVAGAAAVPASAAVTATSSSGVLMVLGDGLDNSITIGRDAAGRILVNGGAVAVQGGTPSVANTTLIRVFGQDGNDAITLNQANGALPAANLFAGAGNDTLSGGSGGDQLFGQSGNDTLLGRGGTDLLFGGDDNDTLTGGGGDDQVFGQSGSDRMVWNPGDDADLNEGGDSVDTVAVNGANGAEQFTVTANGTGVRFERITPAPFAIAVGSSENLVVNANGGDDSFGATGSLAALIKITVDGGVGNDTLRGGDGADVLLGGDGNDFVDGDQGNDLALLGAGDDAFQWDPGDGSDTVEGQAGLDRLLFTGMGASENFELSANGARLRLFRDIGAVTLDADDVEKVALAALGGADTIDLGDLTGTDVGQLNVDLASTLGGPDGQFDRLIYDATPADDSIFVHSSLNGVFVTSVEVPLGIRHADPEDNLVIDTLAGNDSLDTSGFDPASMLLTVR
jgi:hypothetical protein